MECTERISKRSETFLNLFVLTSPLPLKSSFSKCVQEIRNGIIFSVECEDVNKVQATIKGSNFIEIRQNSRLKCESKKPFKKFSFDLKHFWTTALTFDIYPSAQSGLFIEKTLQILKEICHKTNEGIDESVPQLTSQLLQLLEKIPEKDLVNIYKDIKNKKICSNSMHLQTIFLDIIPFVGQEGSLKIMIDLILGGNLTGMRTQLYTASIFFRKNLTSKSIEFIVPVFEKSDTSQTLLLAVGNLIQRYCKQNSSCLELPPLQKIFIQLTKMVKSLCQQHYLNDSQRNKALAVLKTFGNIGIMNELLIEEILNCIHAVHLEPVVRVAAIESFRKMRCSETVRIL